MLLLMMFLNLQQKINKYNLEVLDKKMSCDVNKQKYKQNYLRLLKILY